MRHNALYCIIPVLPDFLEAKFWELNIQQYHYLEESQDLFSVVRSVQDVASFDVCSMICLDLFPTDGREINAWAIEMPSYTCLCLVMGSSLCKYRVKHAMESEETEISPLYIMTTKVTVRDSCEGIKYYYWTGPANVWQ